jgi:dsRNA-specific ribonuclease
LRRGEFYSKQNAKFGVISGRWHFRYLSPRHPLLRQQQHCFLASPTIVNQQSSKQTPEAINKKNTKINKNIQNMNSLQKQSIDKVEKNLSKEQQNESDTTHTKIIRKKETMKLSSGQQTKAASSASTKGESRTKISSDKVALFGASSRSVIPKGQRNDRLRSDNGTLTNFTRKTVKNSDNDESAFDFLAPLQEETLSAWKVKQDVTQNHWKNIENFSQTYLGLRFNNWALFRRALTDKSYINVPSLHNGTLALLGKEIISFNLLDYFVTMGKTFNEAIEQRKLLFNRYLFALFARKLLLHEVIRMNPKTRTIGSELESEKKMNEEVGIESDEEFIQRVLCSTFDALVAAVALDLGHTEAVKLIKEYIRFATEQILRESLGINSDDENVSKQKSNVNVLE